MQWDSFSQTKSRRHFGRKSCWWIAGDDTEEDVATSGLWFYQRAGTTSRQRVRLHGSALQRCRTRSLIFIVMIYFLIFLCQINNRLLKLFIRNRNTIGLILLGWSKQICCLVSSEFSIGFSCSKSLRFCQSENESDLMMLRDCIKTVLIIDTCIFQMFSHSEIVHPFSSTIFVYVLYLYICIVCFCMFYTLFET